LKSYNPNIDISSKQAFRDSFIGDGPPGSAFDNGVVDSFINDVFEFF